MTRKVFSPFIEIRTKVGFLVRKWESISATISSVDGERFVSIILQVAQVEVKFGIV